MTAEDFIERGLLLLSTLATKVAYQRINHWIKGKFGKPKQILRSSQKFRSHRKNRTHV